MQTGKARLSKYMNLIVFPARSFKLTSIKQLTLNKQGSTQKNACYISENLYKFINLYTLRFNTIGRRFAVGKRLICARKEIFRRFRDFCEIDLVFIFWGLILYDYAAT